VRFDLQGEKNPRELSPLFCFLFLGNTNAEKGAGGEEASCRRKTKPARTEPPFLLSLFRKYQCRKGGWWGGGFMPLERNNPGGVCS
jgi:hypothetical protein